MPTLPHGGIMIGRHMTGLSRPPHHGMETWQAGKQACPDLYLAVLGLAGVGTGIHLLPCCILGTQHASKQVSVGFHATALEYGTYENRDVQVTKSCHWD